MQRRGRSNWGRHSVGKFSSLLWLTFRPLFCALMDVMWIIIYYIQGEVEVALKTLEDYKAKCNAKQEENTKFFNTLSL